MCFHPPIYAFPLFCISKKKKPPQSLQWLVFGMSSSSLIKQIQNSVAPLKPERKKCNYLLVGGLQHLKGLKYFSKCANFQISIFPVYSVPLWFVHLPNTLCAFFFFNVFVRPPSFAWSRIFILRHFSLANALLSLIITFLFVTSRPVSAKKKFLTRRRVNSTGVIRWMMAESH